MIFQELELSLGRKCMTERFLRTASSTVFYPPNFSTSVQKHIPTIYKLATFFFFTFISFLFHFPPGQAFKHFRLLIQFVLYLYKNEKYNYETRNIMCEMVYLLIGSLLPGLITRVGWKLTPSAARCC